MNAPDNLCRPGGLGIVVPVLDDAAALAALLPQLAALRSRGARLVVADGGSRDDQRQQMQSLAREAGALWVTSPRGRAVQMNTGATALLLADPGVGALWFIHADSSVPADADRLISQALSSHRWGCFDVRIRGRSRWLPMIARLTNWRASLTGIATGEQGLFMRRGTFEQVGGFAQIAMMEDIDMSRRLKRMAPPACLHETLVDGKRHWDEHGAWRTVALMWLLRWRYWWGAPPNALQRRYHRHLAAAVPSAPGAPHAGTAGGGRG